MSKLYVLIRQDLPKNYQAVQAGHAVAQFMLDHPSLWKNETLIYLRAENLASLHMWVDKLKNMGCKEQSIFHEPDLDNEGTALAFISNLVTDELTKNEKLV